MSHGGGDIGRVHEKLHYVKRKSSGGSHEFVRSLAKIAVAQICESTGFQTFQESALELLSDVVVRYICHIGKTALLYSNMAGRTEANALDVIQGLEDLGLVQGFSGASDIHHCLASSGIVRELFQYIGEAEDIPFAYSIPSFPVAKERKATPSFQQVGKESPGEHIPSWLPTFPDPQTCLLSRRVKEGPTDPNPEKTDISRHDRKPERCLLSFQQQFACNGSEGTSSVPSGDGSKLKQLTTGNPFLAPPLQMGEKETSHVLPPAKLSNDSMLRNPTEQNHIYENHVSVLEAFAPAVEAINGKSFDSDPGGAQKKDISNQRSIIKFKIGAGKKQATAKPDFRPLDNDFKKCSPEKDDKKRRIETILKQSMENPGEVVK